MKVKDVLVVPGKKRNLCGPRTPTDLVARIIHFDHFPLILTLFRCHFEPYAKTEFIL